MSWSSNELHLIYDALVGINGSIEVLTACIGLILGAVIGFVLVWVIFR